MPDAKGSPVLGTVEEDGFYCWIRWDTGVRNGAFPETWFESGEITYYDEWEGNKKKVEKPKNVDLKFFDKLILPEDKKLSIINVLKQQEHADLIFNKWGLGETIEYGKGMNLLFWGDPGTGKTFTARLIAKALGQELLELGTAELQSSLAGEMEKNIVEAFKEAKSKNKVLFFDECDSLLFNRKNVGMILGAEINCLLREIEKFEGVCILATNRIGELDEALERRLSLIMKFPTPDEAQQIAILKSLIPKEFPLHKDVKLEEIAGYGLTGGLLKNVLLNAARTAAASGSKDVKHEHFVGALKTVAQGQVAFEEEESFSPTTHGYVQGGGKSRNKYVQTSSKNVLMGH